jgi:hypothetical protein
MSFCAADAFQWYTQQAIFIVFVGVLVTTKVAHGAPHPRLWYSSRDAERHQPVMFENLQESSIPPEIRQLQIPGQVIRSARESAAILRQVKVTEIETRSAEALDDRQSHIGGILKGLSRSAYKTRAASVRPQIHSKFTHSSQLFHDDNPIPSKILLLAPHSGPRKNRASEEPQLTRPNFVAWPRSGSPAHPSGRLQGSSRPAEAHQWIRLPSLSSLQEPILREQASESPFALKSTLVRVSPLSPSRTLYGLLAVGGVFIVGAVIGAVIIVARRNEASADTNFEASPSSSSNLSGGDAREEGRHPAQCESASGRGQKSEAASTQNPNHIDNDEDTPKVVSMGDILGNNSSAFVSRSEYCDGRDDHAQSASKPCERPLPQAVIRKASLSRSVERDSKVGESATKNESGGGSKRQAVKERLLTLTKPKAPETPGASKAAWFATPKAAADGRAEFPADIGGGGSSNSSKESKA